MMLSVICIIPTIKIPVLMIKITRSAPLKEDGIIPLAGMDYPATVQIMEQDRYLKPLSIVDEAGNKYTSVHDRLGRVSADKSADGHFQW